MHKNTKSGIIKMAAQTWQSTSAAKMLIKLFKKIFALDKSLFNIVMGNLFPGTY
jgi:hypothetical protein